MDDREWDGNEAEEKERVGVKMIIAIVQEQDAGEVTRSLREAGIAHTSLKTRGGFLQRGNVMYLIGVDDPKVDRVLATIHQHSHQREVMHRPDLGAMHPDAYVAPTTVTVGGAVIFILDVADFRRR